VKIRHPADAVSFSRALLVFAWIYCHAHQNIWAVVVVVVIVLSDVIDGPIARRTGTAGPRGAAVDVACDVFVILASTLAAGATDPLCLLRVPGGRDTTSAPGCCRSRRAGTSGTACARSPSLRAGRLARRERRAVSPVRDQRGNGPTRDGERKPAMILSRPFISLPSVLICGHPRVDF
jgi:phosphatidylglycerophosphate synthase